MRGTEDCYHVQLFSGSLDTRPLDNLYPQEFAIAQEQAIKWAKSGISRYGLIWDAGDHSLLLWDTRLPDGLLQRD